MPANLVVEHIDTESGLRLRFTIQLSLKAPDPFRRFKTHRQSPSPCFLQKRSRSQGPSLRRHYPASAVLRPCPTPAIAAILSTTLRPLPSRQRASPDYPHHLVQRAVPTTPANQTGASVDCFPVR